MGCDSVAFLDVDLACSSKCRNRSWAGVGEGATSWTATVTRTKRDLIDNIFFACKWVVFAGYKYSTDCCNGVECMDDIRGKMVAELLITGDEK